MASNGNFNRDNDDPQGHGKGCPIFRQIQVNRMMGLRTLLVVKHGLLEKNNLAT